MTACMANLTFINTFVVIEYGGTVDAVLSVLIVVCENDFLLFVKKLFICSCSKLKAVVQCVFDYSFFFV